MTELYPQFLDHPTGSPRLQVSPKAFQMDSSQHQVMTLSPRAFPKQINRNLLSPRDKAFLPCMQSFIDRTKLSQNGLDTPSLSRQGVIRKLVQGAQALDSASEDIPYRLENILHSVTRSLLRDVGNGKDDIVCAIEAKKHCSIRFCGVEECLKRAKTGGLCIAHGGGLRCSERECQKHAVTLGLCISHGGGKRCSNIDCVNASRKHGVCWSHGARRFCKQSGCTKGPKYRGLCWSHGKLSDEASHSV
uniref:Uncharacterized protein AlNc14C150G7493 n=1 Tax=Albugo laibachii Nc14 TaxID=890382 RepID=F0WLY0_9STRA|nr:conserved hypothetical protein [Albugo laibachii Nc14]|eukprot:CCA22307.1 conserved hypothetical protein [Albugo laibachii Nc14]